jgi:hypothetical protein
MTHLDAQVTLHGKSSTSFVVKNDARCDVCGHGIGEGFFAVQPVDKGRGVQVTHL